MLPNDDVGAGPANGAGPASSNNPTNNDGQANQVIAVENCKVPQFWKNSPDLWFLQLESVFEASRITSDKSKYHLVISNLDSTAIHEVADVLRNPPDRDKYTHLKNILMQRFSDSADRQLHRVLTELELGDKKPSQLLRQMKNLAGTRASEDVLRVKWLDLLPDYAQRFLKIFKAPTLDELAIAADELLENYSASQVMATEAHQKSNQVIPAQRSPQPSSAADPLLAELSSIQKSLAELLSVNNSIARKLAANQGDRSRSKSRSRTSSPGKNGLCFYHQRFGSKAYRCTPPCNSKDPVVPRPQSEN
ncbi:uncharacterized protein [Venturia canescens]|uniref:uncharacterized protein n=1 Tax=Venturia canescens TaxID=32260 RepID=UPI001C9D5A2C|nr:uncharacterized protein LOC122410292 [Venturia canescens]